MARSGTEFDTSNWGQAPQNRSSFQYVQSLFPTARIRRGTRPASVFTLRNQDLTDITYLGLDGQQRSVQQMLDDTYTDAFLVIQDDAVVMETYDNGMDPDSHHLLNSVSKTFLSMLVGTVVAEGLINLREKVTKYLPEFTNTAFRDTTVQHALDMTAAVSFGEDYADPLADFWVETSVVGWRPALVNDRTPATLYDYARSLTMTEQLDGEKFHYRTVLTNVLSMVVERATGEQVQRLLEQRIWQKLCPEQDAAVVVDASGFPYMGAGMNACTRDLGRFGQMLLRDGEANGESVVPSEWIRQTRTGNDHLRSLFAETEYANLYSTGHYCNQTWAVADRGLLICMGIHGQIIYSDQSSRVVIVKLSTHPESADMTLFGDMLLAMDAISSSLS